MKRVAPRRVALSILVAFLLVLVLNWKDFMEGFRGGLNGSMHSSQPKADDLQIASNSSFSQGSSSAQVQSTSKKQNTQNLEIYRGRVFSVSKPSDWKVIESANGIDVYDPSSNETVGIGGAVLIGAAGQATPMQFADGYLSTLGVQVEKVVREQMLPSEPGAMGTQWQRGVKEYILLRKGARLHVQLYVAVCNGWGQFSTQVKQMYSPASEWAKWESTLSAMAESLKIIDGSAVGGVREMAASLPKNNPADSSSIMSTWENKMASDTRISQGQQEAMMGYQRGLSESTGRYHDVPLNTYDPTIGGYRNPDNPNEMLNTDYDQ